MPNRRPTSVLVIAVLQLVFGGMRIICGACALAGSGMGDQAAFQGGGANNPEQVKMQEPLRNSRRRPRKFKRTRSPAFASTRTSLR
jgi:hypothetical protein